VRVGNGNALYGSAPTRRCLAGILQCYPTVVRIESGQEVDIYILTNILGGFKPGRVALMDTGPGTQGKLEINTNAPNPAPATTRPRGLGLARAAAAPARCLPGCRRQNDSWPSASATGS